MSDVVLKPKRRRWRWLGVVVLLGTISAAWVLLRRPIDLRIVGVWQLENSGTQWTFGGDGEFNSSGTRNDPKRWWVKGDSLIYAYPADLTIRSIVNRVVRRLKGASDSIIPRHSMRVVEVSTNRIVIEQPYGHAPAQVLRRVPN